MSSPNETQEVGMYQKGLAAGIVLPLCSKLIVNIDNIEQWIGELAEETEDGMVELEQVQKRLEYFTKLMIANIEETKDRVR